MKPMSAQENLREKDNVTRARKRLEREKLARRHRQREEEKEVQRLRKGRKYE